VGRRKKTRKNYRKGAKKKAIFAFLRPLVMGFYVIAGVAGLAATSALFIFVHDVITQCDYFKANSLKIEGTKRLTPEQVAEVARLSKGMNVLEVNLSIARKRLLAHPWIAEAEVRREIPAGLHVRIREHSPLAIIDLGRKYMIDEKGKVFKEWTDSDPDKLPLVSGLQLSDIRDYDNAAVNGSRRPENGSNPAQTERPLNRPYEAVLQVLMLGKQARGILSNRNIKRIQVDRETGITIEAFKQLKTIVLGYHNYRLKYNMLKNILVYRNERRDFPDFNRIDLNDVNRIVVNPVGKIPAGDHKEV
jgi:cell division protein FtsQ